MLRTDDQVQAAVAVPNRMAAALGDRSIGKDVLEVLQQDEALLAGGELVEGRDGAAQLPRQLRRAMEVFASAPELARRSQRHRARFAQADFVSGDEDEARFVQPAATGATADTA